MFKKSIIVSHTKPELIRATGGIDIPFLRDELETISGRKLSSQIKTFQDRGGYGNNIVLEKGLFILNSKGEILVSSGRTLPSNAESLLVSGSGTKNFRTIADEKIIGKLGDDLGGEVFSLTETSPVSTYAFITKPVIGKSDFSSRINRIISWRNPDTIEENEKITPMEKNLFQHFRKLLLF